MSQPMTLLSPDLTDAERRMVSAAVRGEVADLAGLEVRGRVLRDLILEARPGWLLPRAGLSLSRLVVVDGLDLDGAVVDKPVTLSEARIEPLDSRRTIGAAGAPPALVLASARIRRLTLHASVVAGSLLADRVEIESSLLIGGGEIEGVVQLRGGVVRGSLAIEGTVLGDGKVALAAAGLRVDGPVVMRRSTFRGVATLARTRIGGGIQAEAARLNGGLGADLDLEGARIVGDVTLDGAVADNGVVLGGLSGDGRVSLAQSRIGVLGLLAPGLSASGPLMLSGAKLSGPLRLDGAAIGGRIAAGGLEVHGGERAISLRDASVGGRIDLDSAKLVGSLDISSARITGALTLSNARLFGSALALEGKSCRFGSGLSLARAVVFGQVTLANADIGESLSLAGASIKVERGEALDASGASIRGDVDLGEGFNSVGGIRLERARVQHGRLQLAGSQIVSLARADPSAPQSAGDHLALGLSGARIALVEMPSEPRHRPRGTIDLSHAQVGEFVDHATAWPLPLPGHDDHLVLSGFVYRRLANPSGTSGSAPQALGRRERRGAGRIAWLEAQPQSDLEHAFKPQPWNEVVRHLSAAGLREEARAVTFAGLRLRRRTVRGHAARWADRLDDVLTGYGYRPWRPVIALAAVMVAFAALYAAAAKHCPAGACEGGPAFIERTVAVPADRVRVRPAEFDALGYSLDVLVPLLDLGHADRWQANPGWLPISPPRAVAEVVGDIANRPGLVTGGALLEIARHLERALGGLLVVLALAGLVRPPRKLE